MKIKFRRVWEKPRNKMLPSAVERAPISVSRVGVFRIEYNDDSLPLDIFIGLDGKINLFLPEETRARLIN